MVHVLTPNREHSEISIAALQAGKHVMCEKPMAKTAEDARKMYEAAKASGKRLTIGYQNRQLPSVKYAKKFIDTGAMGEIYYANCYAMRRRGTPNWGVFLDEEAQGGGPIIDIATHSLDVTLHLMQNYEPKMVLGKTHKKLEHPEAGNIWGDHGVSSTALEEAACAIIIMKNGATIMLETSWALNIPGDDQRGLCTLCGSKAGMNVKPDKLTINKVELDRPVDTVVNLDAGGVDFFDGATSNPADAEARQWIDSIVHDTTPDVLPEEALVVSEILEAIYVSSKTGKPVYFE